MSSSGPAIWRAAFAARVFRRLICRHGCNAGSALAPSNIFLSAFGPIQVTTLGTEGEVFLIPDPDSRVLVPFEGSTAEYFFLGDIKTRDGAPWNFCPRHILRRAIERLKSETGLQLLATFEQEFTYSGVAAEPWQPYELGGFRRQGRFGGWKRCCPQCGKSA